MLAPNPVNSSVAEILRFYACGPVPLPSDPDAAFQRHLVFDHMIDPAKGSTRSLFRDLPAQSVTSSPGAGFRPRTPITALTPSTSITCRWSSLLAR